MCEAAEVLPTHTHIQMLRTSGKFASLVVTAEPVPTGRGGAAPCRACSRYRGVRGGWSLFVGFGMEVKTRHSPFLSPDGCLAGQGGGRQLTLQGEIQVQSHGTS